MSQFFAVEIKTTAIVWADDADHAVLVARDHRREICGDVDMDISVKGEVKRIDQLAAHEWDGECIPYGHDGDTRLMDLLANQGAQEGGA
ncbi:MAG: hypothetical protein A3E79_01025 [Burkholderiales bacterium RIFCSPHIGHO2_12_FULL_61_11]|nr:MAG: hypothetical protein A3E79_01025 [Burkholderiales bacterium RIFCSPHIGHO2_12_FULL_61_11]